MERGIISDPRMDPIPTYVQPLGKGCIETQPAGARDLPVRQPLFALLTEAAAGLVAASFTPSSRHCLPSGICRWEDG